MSTQRIITRSVPTPIGPMTLGITAGQAGPDHGICLCEFPGTRTSRAVEELTGHLGCPIEPDGTDPTGLIDEARRQLDAYFEGRLRAFDLPLITPGTEFQQAVWAELVRIPYGQTITYADLADRVGSPGAQRAVGAANGRNRISIIIPCHRVIDSNGNLHGYGGGLDRKRALLELEGALEPEPTLF